MPDIEVMSPAAVSTSSLPVARSFWLVGMGLTALLGIVAASLIWWRGQRGWALGVAVGITLPSAMTNL